MCGHDELTFHVIRFQCVTDIQRGRPQQHVRLEGLMAPHTKHQFAEGSHNSVGEMGSLKPNMQNTMLCFIFAHFDLDKLHWMKTAGGN